MSIPVVQKEPKRKATAAEKKALKDVFNLVASIPEGKKLLKLAKDTGTNIRYSDALTGTHYGSTNPLGVKVTIKGGKLMIEETPQYEVLLQGGLGTEKTALTLAHELRHVWQNVQLAGMRPMHMTPALSIAYTRMLEGDARVFEEYFRARLEEKKAGYGRADYTPDEWKSIFISYQKAPVATDYDETMLQGTAKLVASTSVAPKPELRVKLNKQVFGDKARQALKGASTILRTGLSRHAKPYFDASDPEKLAAELLSYATTKTKKEVERLDRMIRTGRLPRKPAANPA